MCIIWQKKKRMIKNYMLDLDCTDASVYTQVFVALRDQYHYYIPVYTDGLQDGNSVACATICP